MHAQEGMELEGYHESHIDVNGSHIWVYLLKKWFNSNSSQMTH